MPLSSDHTASRIQEWTWVDGYSVAAPKIQLHWNQMNLMVDCRYHFCRVQVALCKRFCFSVVENFTHQLLAYFSLIFRKNSCLRKFNPKIYLLSIDDMILYD